MSDQSQDKAGIESLIGCRHPSSTNGLCDECGNATGTIESPAQKTAAQWAVSGHPDDPRTSVSWILALNGVQTMIEDLIEQFEVRTNSKEELWRSVAAALDGFDGEARVKALLDAYEELKDMRDALQRALTEYEAEKFRAFQAAMGRTS